PSADTSAAQRLPAPLMRPLISKNRGATIRRRSALRHQKEIRVPATDEIQAYHLTRPDRASSAFRLMALVDAGRRVSSVAPLTILWRSNVPSLLQRLADLGLREPFLFRKIFARGPWLSDFCDELGCLHIVWLR